MRTGSRPRQAIGVVVAAACIVLPACGAGAGAAGSSSTPAAVLRLGYFPNLTHASALIGVAKGYFAAALGGQTRLETHTFNAGPAAVEALFSQAIDAAYIGPSPAVNAYVKSHGEAVRIISGATSGGASLVVRASIQGPADLRGKKIADPQLGGTQDVSLRWWLGQHGLHADTHGGGDVAITPQDNSQTLQTFRSGEIDGAWLPEPWAARLVVEAGARTLVDERDVWPGGRFATTNLVVRTDFLRQHPDTVRRLLVGEVRADRFIATQPDEARAAANAEIETITGKKLPPAVVASAWATLSFTDDPLAASVRAQAEHAVKVGLLEQADLRGIYDLSLLNQVLAEAGQPPVSSG